MSAKARHFSTIKNHQSEISNKTFVTRLFEINGIYSDLFDLLDFLAMQDLSDVIDLLDFTCQGFNVEMC